MSIPHGATLDLAELGARLGDVGEHGPDTSGPDPGGPDEHWPDAKPQQPSPRTAWRPWLVRLAAGEHPELMDLCGRHGITLIDRFDSQLEELAQIRHPDSSASAARARLVAGILEGDGGAPCAGTWVCFPWERKIVHLLGRDDFFDVVTSRNQDKITRHEQLELRTKRIGVVGLSVGAEIAVAVAQEHLCGSIRLADFDSLELSNLNRLGAGVDDLGLNKAHLTARRILKIDPYLDVEVHEHGVSRDNADDFLAGLDLLIEECDGLQMKFHLRELARERRLNLLYAADERGMLSIEPYAHAPDMPPFHGRIDSSPPPRESFPSTRAFLRSLTAWLGGWDSISERSRRSVERIGESLCGYPQLASESRLAAGQVAHAARRLLLGEHLSPYLDRMDLEQLLPVGERE